MEADVQAQEQIEAQTEETTEQSEVTEESQSSEESETSEKTETTQEETDKGDLRVPLKEERTKRQELEGLIQNPNFIAQQAQRMGIVPKKMTAGDTETVETGESVSDVVDFQLSMRDFPELAKDPEALAYAGTLKELYPNITYREAMQKAQDKFASAKQQGVSEGRTQAKTETNDKIKAQTIGTGQVEQSSNDGLQERLQSPDKAIREDALVEMMIARNKKLGY